MKNNKIVLLFAVALLFTATFFSCEEDVFTEKDAIELNRSYETTDNSAEYTILVVDAAKSTMLKSANATSAMAMVKVTLTQDGESVTDTTDASGMVVFKGLKQGTVAVSIQATGYSEVNLVANLDQGEKEGGSKVSNLIPMIPIATTTGTIKGKVTYESDLTNTTKENAASVNLVATVDVNSDALDGIKTGVIEQISYSDLSLTATTDDNGDFEMTVPSTAEGLEYEVKVSDFTADQTIYMNSFNDIDATTAAEVTRTVSTVFGSNGNLSGMPAAVSPLFITIAAPNSTKSGSGAQATAIIKNDNGLESVNLTNNGTGYTNGTYTLTIDNNDDDTDGSADNATIKVVVNNNIVTYIDVTDEGANFTSGTINLNHQFVEFEAIVTSVDGGGAITGINITNNGQFLINPSDLEDLEIIIASDDGRHADIEVNSMHQDWSSNYYYPSLIINDGGDDYEVDDKVSIRLKNSGTVAVGNKNLTSSSVVAITIDNAGSGYTTGKIFVELIGGGGQGATVDYPISVVNGKIDFITIDDGGYGYTEAPTVVIHDLNQLKTAKVSVNASDFDDDGAIKLSSVVADDGGAGYFEIPTVTFDAVAAGSGIEGSVVLEDGQVKGVIFTKPGSGYKAKNTLASNVEVDPIDVKIAGVSTKILNIYLGQGFRTDGD